MQKFKENYKLNNRGFTLIEMVVTVAIIAIFAGVVLSFITTGSNFFRNTSNTAKVQMETQETFDKIEDMIINSNRKLSYGDSSHIFEVASFDEQIAEKSGGIATASLRSVNSGTDSTVENEENVRDYIIWNESTEEITYIHSEKSDGTWKNSNTSSTNPRGDVLATGVTYFQADVSKAVSDNIVNFVLKTKKGTKEVETTHSVSLRNNLQFDYVPDEPFDNPTIEPVTPGPDNPTPDPEEPKPISLSSDKKKILIAAGVNYDLSSNITWSVLYSDTNTVVAGKLRWSIDNCSYASITSDGLLSIDASAGTADTGTVTVKVIDTDHNNVFGSLKVSIARLDFTAPANNGCYLVGQDKQLQYTYLEGGRVPQDAQSAANITTKTKPEEADEYKQGEKFVQNDVGFWEMNATVDVSSRSGYDLTYGSLTASTAFTVIGGWSNDIIINQNTAIGTIIAGRTYQCAPTVNWGFNFAPKVDGFWENSVIEWSVKDPESNPGVSMNNGDITSQGKEASLTIDASVKKGFTICAKYIKYTDASRTQVLQSIEAEKTVNVANGIEITPSGDTAYVYESNDSLYSSDIFLLDVELNIYDINGTVSQIKISDQDGTVLHWDNLGSGSMEGTSDGNWRYYASAHNVESILKIKASLQTIPNIFDPSSNFQFEDSVDVTIAEPLYTARIIPDGDETIQAGTSEELYLQLVDKNNNPVDREVTWSIEENWSDLLSPKTTRTGEISKVTFTPDKPGTYVISATYTAITNKSHTVKKTITVGKPKADISIIGPETVIKTNTEKYWLSVKIGEETLTDLNVTWKWKHSETWEDTVGNTKSSQESPVSVKFDTNDKEYELIAEFTLYGEQYTASKIIAVRKPDVNLQIHGNDHAYKLGEEKYWLSAEVEGRNRTDLDVTWKWEHTSDWIDKLETGKSDESSQVNVKFGTDNTYRLRAEVTIGGDTYSTTMDITLQDPPSEIILRDKNNQTESTIFADQTIDLTASIKVNGKDYSVASWRWNWKCVSESDNTQQYNVLEGQGNNILFKPAGNGTVKKGGIFIITVSCKLHDNDTVTRQATYRVTVKPPEAKIVADKNKVSLSPGESTQLYLVVQNGSSIIDAQSWWSTNDDALKLSTGYLDSTYSNGNIIPITVTANENITETKKVTVTVNYTEKKTQISDSLKITITITP